jgi:hypothetical protein
MNLKNKIVNMGFRKCQFHRLEWDRDIGKYKMALDDYEIKSKYDRELKKWISYETKVHHPKWSKFYSMDINGGVKIWMLIEKDVIVKVWLDSIGLKDGVKMIYPIKDEICINSKSDIINLFPKEIKRDLLIKDILG